VKPPHEREILANLERASESLLAAQALHARGFYDFAASRAYYAAFYAATAALLRENLVVGKHSGVIALVHRHLVRTGRLAEEQGKVLNWLFELRGVGDYGVLAHVPGEEAERAIHAAEEFVSTVKALLRSYPPPPQDGRPR